jgi:serine protease Do
MRHMLCRAAVFAAILIFLGGAGTEKQARASLKDRRNKVVVAVEKTRDSVVRVQVFKKGKWSIREVTGTGVIVDERGYVVTNHHVVAGAERLRVYLRDKTELAAEVFLNVPEYDLAILHLVGAEKYKLEALRFAPTRDLMVGEDVIAVGHPYGYQNSVSRGIVSALGRVIEAPSGVTLEGLIQTDAPINPGNSGGPLLNIDGEMIGINVALRDGAQGIAFALDAGRVQSILSRSLSARKVAHVDHGLTCKEEAKPEADERGVRQRVVVERVEDRSPAARAGLRAKDVILRVGEEVVSNRFDLERALWRYHKGDRVEAKIVRDGKVREVSLTLGE